MQSDNKIEKRREDNQAKENRIDDLSRAQWLPSGLFRAIGPVSLIVIIAGGIAAYYAYNHVTKDSVRLQFWVGFMFSLLAFVVLLIQSVIYAQQAEFMKEQSKAMQRSVELTDAIIENMDKQLTSLVHQETAMQGQLEHLAVADRAYIGIRHGKFIRPLAGGESPSVRLIFVNGGKTPAWAFRSHYRLVISDKPVAEVRAEFPVEFIRLQGGAFIPAGQLKRVEVPFSNYKIDSLQLIAVNAKLMKLFIFAEVEFRDFRGDWQYDSYSIVYNADTRELEEADPQQKPN